MSDLSTFEKYYKTLPDAYLLEVASKPYELRKDVIPIILQELYNRKLEDAAIALSEFISGKTVNLREMTIPEIRRYIDNRVAKGDSLDDINYDLKEAEIHIFDVMNYEVELEENALNTFEKLKEEKYSDEEINQKMQEEFSFTALENEEIKSRLAIRGKRNVIAGYWLIGLGLLILLLSLAVGEIKLMSFVTIAGGVALVVRGKQQMKL